MRDWLQLAFSGPVRRRALRLTLIVTVSSMAAIQEMGKKGGA